MAAGSHEEEATGCKQQRRASMGQVSHGPRHSLMGGNAHEAVASAGYPKAVFTVDEERYIPPELLDAARDPLTRAATSREGYEQATGAERLATQRRARMAAIGRRPAVRKPSREAMSRPTIGAERLATQRRAPNMAWKVLTRAATSREAPSKPTMGDTMGGSITHTIERRRHVKATNRPKVDGACGAITGTMERKPHVKAPSKPASTQGKGLRRAETLREATRGPKIEGGMGGSMGRRRHVKAMKRPTSTQGRGSPPRKAMNRPKIGEAAVSITDSMGGSITGSMGRKPHVEAPSSPASAQGRRSAPLEATNSPTGAQGKGLRRAETSREATNRPKVDGGMGGNVTGSMGEGWARSRATGGGGTSKLSILGAHRRLAAPYRASLKTYSPLTSAYSLRFPLE